MKLNRYGSSDTYIGKKLIWFPLPRNEYSSITVPWAQLHNSSSCHKLVHAIKLSNCETTTSLVHACIFVCHNIYKKILNKINNHSKQTQRNQDSPHLATESEFFPYESQHMDFIFASLFTIMEQTSRHNVLPPS